MTISDKEKFNQIANLAEGNDVIRILNVDHVNYDPHIFCLTPAHINHSQKYGGRISEECIIDAEKNGIFCGVDGCILPYSEHKSDCVAFVQLLRTCTKSDIEEILYKITVNLPDGFIDGFAFVDTPEKFSIENG